MFGLVKKRPGGHLKYSDSTELFQYSRMRNRERKTQDIVETRGEAPHERFLTLKGGFYELNILREKNVCTLSILNIVSFSSATSSVISDE